MQNEDKYFEGKNISPDASIVALYIYNIYLEYSMQYMGWGQLHRKYN
jgi:hypothetical protein